MCVHTCAHTGTHTLTHTHARTHAHTQAHIHTCPHTDVLLHAQHGGPGVLLKYGSAFYQRNGSPSCFILCEILPVLTNGISPCYYALVCLHTHSMHITSSLSPSVGKNPHLGHLDYPASSTTYLCDGSLKGGLLPVSCLSRHSQRSTLTLSRTVVSQSFDFRCTT